MCGIWAYISQQPITPEKRELLMKAFNTTVHRGPNASRVLDYDEKVMLGFHRLSIVDISSNGMAPFLYKDLVCIANAEIYNYEILGDELRREHHDSFKSSCDTEVIAPLFDYVGKDMDQLCKKLDGEYAFALYDTTKKIVYYATDEISMRPLFICLCENGDICLSSELLGLDGMKIKEIKRLGAGQWGKIQCGDNKNIFEFNTFNSLVKSSHLPITYEEARNRLREIFIQNVEDKVHRGPRNDGFFLSGGLDSSLTAGVAAKLRKDRPLNTFCVGFSADASDIVYARQVAAHLKSNHHEIIVSQEDGLNAVEEIIKMLGTFDQTTIRATTPLYLATKWIKEKYPDIYIMYNGELADELFGGYLYFRNAPSPADHRAESIRRLLAVHNYDGLRCDRVCAWHSIEARFPFFSKTLLDFVMSCPPEYFNPSNHKGVEKYIVRDAFRDLGYIPDEVLWRTKNALSDATSVKSSWKEKLKQWTDSLVSDEDFATREKWQHSTPDTKEDYYYRTVFEKYYPRVCETTIPYKWLPLWCGDVKDSSASVLQVFNEDDPSKLQQKAQTV